MTTARMLAVAAVLMGSGLSFAGPAAADQVMQGSYAYDQGDVHATWTIHPICVPTVGDLRENLELPVACTLHVAPAPVTLVSGGDARLTGGVWEFSTTKKSGLTCPDGSTAPIRETYEFDDLTMTGTRSVANDGACDGEVAANVVEHPFTLAFQGPLPIPVQQYPLYCDPAGLKRCR